MSRPVRQELSTNFVKPDLGARKRNLLASTSLKAEDTDAYESKSIGAGVAIERPLWSDRVAGSLGVAYRLGQTKLKDEEEDSFGLLSLPGTIRMDYSDNLLDPTKGWRLNLLAAPYTDTLNAGDSFLKTQLTATTYLRLTESAKYILALRGTASTPCLTLLGSIVAISVEFAFWAGAPNRGSPMA